MLRIAAISAAIVTLLLGVVYLRFSRETEGVPVVVAAQRIVAGTRITDEMVEVAHVPNEHFVEGAYADPSLVVGQVAKVAFGSGEQVTACKVLSATETSLFGSGGGLSIPSAVPLATTLNVEPITTQGEPIFAGDRIDILIETDCGATTVAENVEVLSGEVWGLGSPIQETITIAIMPQQAQRLRETLRTGGKILFDRSPE